MDHRLAPHGHFAHQAASAHANGKAQECPKKVHDIDVDDLPSTAAPSVMHSPYGGFDVAPEGSDVDLVLGPSHAGSLHSDSPTSGHGSRPDVRHVIEGLFAPEHLRQDFNLRVSMTEFGWVPLREVLHLLAARRLQNISLEEAAAALKDSRAVQLSGDSRRVRARDPTLWSAFLRAPKVQDVKTRAFSSPASTACPEEFASEAEVADEDLTIAAHLETTPRASKEGNPWPCVEWLTSEPQVDEPCLDWLLSEVPLPTDLPEPEEHPQPAQSSLRSRRRRAEPVRRRRAPAKEAREQRRASSPAIAAHQRQQQRGFAGLDSELAEADLPDFGAWIRVADDCYATAASSLLGW